MMKLLSAFKVWLHHLLNIQGLHNNRPKITAYHTRVDRDKPGIQVWNYGLGMTQGYQLVQTILKLSYSLNFFMHKSCGVGGLWDFIDRPEAKFIFPFLDLTLAWTWDWNLVSGLPIVHPIFAKKSVELHFLPNFPGYHFVFNGSESVHKYVRGLSFTRATKLSHFIGGPTS